MITAVASQSVPTTRPIGAGAPPTPSTPTAPDGSQLQSYSTAGQLDTETRGLPSDATRSASVTRSQAVAASQVTGGQPLGSLRTGAGQAPEYASGVGTLDYDTRTCDPALDSKPLVPEGGRWDGARILNGLGQLDTAPRSDNQEVRCGASSLLAGAIMNGRDATAAYTERLSAQVTDPQQQQQLQGIRDRLLDGSATNADMHNLQSLTYQRYSQSGTPGLTTDELTRAQRDLTRNVQLDPVGEDANLAGGRRVQTVGNTIEQPGRTGERVANLQNGQSFTQFVDTNGDGDVNHFVQVGRDQNGRTYLYDPYPANNQPHVIYQQDNPQAFNHYTNGSMGATTDNGTLVNVVAGGTVQF